ncbi:MAG: histidine--tRNA ligase [Acidimicrobiales bacterium]
MTLMPLSGIPDLADKEAGETEAVADEFRTQFRRFGYSPIAPPVLERATTFLDRSGEDIRGRMYIFTDPGGDEVCLRPELTIPTARLYANRFQGRGGTVRAYYIGPVFRYDSPREGRYRQFTQAGAELIGEGNPPAADAEVMALAYQALTAIGCQDLRMVVSDVSLFSALFKDSRVSERWRARLSRISGDPSALLRELDRGQPTANQDDLRASTSHIAATVGESLLTIAPEERPGVVAAIIEALGADHVGVRSASEIADRLLRSSNIDPAEPLDADVADILRALLEVDDSAPSAVQRLRDLATRTDSPAFGQATRWWEERLSLMSAHGVDVDLVRMQLQLRRGIDYYSGFIFEVHSADRSPVSQLCAGGRYDELVRTIGGRDGAPAVGFAAGVERVLLDLKRRGAAPRPRDVSVIVVSGGNVPEFECVRVATALRAAGVSAEMVTGHRTRYALRSALRRGVRYLVVVGEEELGRGEVVVRDLERNEQIALPIIGPGNFTDNLAATGG